MTVRAIAIAEPNLTNEHMSTISLHLKIILEMSSAILCAQITERIRLPGEDLTIYH